MKSFLDQLDFQLDPFQLEAMDAIVEGHSVVVCAPTGSGKTMIAEFAAHRAIEQGVKLLYTTPLKALSNQKFHDFRKQFGEDNVGLLTGDISINREARLVVMTTEIFRNMLYGLNEDSTLLKKVKYVVLDECHYMNDAQRGTVWEESIIYCPESIQLIALSATVANADELTQWINTVHHDTRLIESDFRPVPLRFFYFNREELMPLFQGPGQLNKKLKFDQKGNRMARNVRIFKPNDLIREMHERDMLPAIFFTFSRKGCDQYMRDTRHLPLLSQAEKKYLEGLVDDYVRQHPFLKGNPMLEPVKNGFASHHAGLLPAMKVLVEHLFQQGLIKVVFATETLAAGINMPARSTVITSISKRSDDGHRLLTASEFLQMSGRAGRRGMDDVGYVTIVSSPYHSAREAATLASSPSDPLNSQFTPTYGMVLNLLQKSTLEQAEYLIRKSFGQFTSERRLDPVEAELKEKTAELEEALNFTCTYGVSDKEFHGYLKSRELLSESGRYVKILQKQLKQHGKSREMIQELARETGKKKNLTQTVEASPCNTCPIINKHRRVEERIHKLQRQLKYLNIDYERQHDIYWRSFKHLYLLLKDAGCLVSDDDMVAVATPKGVLTSQVRTENELFLTEIITEGLLDSLTPPQLGGILCSLVNDSNRENLWSKLRASPETWQAVMDIQRIAKRIRKLQEKYAVEVPIIVNPVAVGLVEAWCQGMTWQQLISETNIDEGDLVRMIRRTADLLRQLSRIGEISPELNRKAQQALAMLYRDPVKEVEVTEEVDEALIESE